MAAQHPLSNSGNGGLQLSANACTLDDAAVINLFGGAAPASPLDALEGMQVPDCSELIKSELSFEFCSRGEYLLSQKPDLAGYIRSVFNQGLMAEGAVSELLNTEEKYLPSVIFNAFSLVCGNLVSSVSQPVQDAKRKLVESLSSFEYSEVERIADSIDACTADVLPVVVSSDILGDEFLEDGFGLGLRESPFPHVYDLELGGFNNQYSDLELAYFYILERLAVFCGISTLEDSLNKFGFYGTNEIFESVNVELFLKIKSASEQGLLESGDYAAELVAEVLQKEEMQSVYEELTYCEEDGEFSDMCFLDRILEVFTLKLLSESVCEWAARSGFGGEQYFIDSSEHFQRVREAVTSASSDLSGRNVNPLCDRPFADLEQLRSALLAILDYLEDQNAFDLHGMERWSDSCDMEVHLIEETALSQLEGMYGDCLGDTEPLFYKLPQDHLSESLLRRAIFRFAFGGVFSLLM